MIQKLLSLALVLCVLFGMLAACGADEPIVPQQTNPPDESTQASEEQPTENAGDAQELTLNRDDITLIRLDEKLDLYDGSIPTTAITWSSKDTSVATFENGIVTAVGAGQTTVYAEYEGVKVSCKVYCNIKETKPTDPTEGNTGTTAAGPREPVKAAPTNEVVNSSFFNDAVFVGDSISLRLSYYAADSGALGAAKFLVRGSYGVGNEVTGAFYLTYQGEEMKLTDALSKIGAKKLFIMLGMNDIGLYGIDPTIENWGKLLKSVREKNPDIQIYIQSMTPVWTGGEKGGLKNPNVNAYNEKLQAFAESNGCKYIDVASYMKDSTGGLATKFCSDSFVHLTDAGAIVWIKVLKAYTGY